MDAQRARRVLRGVTRTQRATSRVAVGVHRFRLCWAVASRYRTVSLGREIYLHVQTVRCARQLGKRVQWMRRAWMGGQMGGINAAGWSRCMQLDLDSLSRLQAQAEAIGGCVLSRAGNQGS